VTVAMTVAIDTSKTAYRYRKIENFTLFTSNKFPREIAETLLHGSE
jgi:hypothetical protein